MLDVIILLWPSFFSMIVLSFLSAPTGLLLVWNRSTFLTDGLGHAALLSFALFFLTPLPLSITLFLLVLLMTILLTFSDPRYGETLEHNGRIQALTCGLFSMGALLMTSFGVSQRNLDHVLWGEMLGISSQDFAVITLYVILGLLFLWKTWHVFIALLVDPVVASLEGLPVQRTKALLWFFLSLHITITLRYFGVLMLSTSLLAPALIASALSKTPLDAVQKALGVSIALLLSAFLICSYYPLALSPTLGFLSSVSLMTQQIISATFYGRTKRSQREQKTE